MSTAPMSARAACPFDCTDLATATGNINTTGQTLTNDINAGSTYGAGAIISGTGNVVVTDGGATANFWQLTSANTFSGTMTVQTGATVFTTINNAVGNASTVTINTGGAFNLGTTNQTLHNLTGGGSILTGTGGILTENGTGTFSGVISGAGSLATTGTGNLTLSGVNTYTGSTTVGSGTTLTFSGGNDRIAESSAVTNNGTIAIGTTSQTLNVLSGAGNISTGSGGQLTLNGTQFSPLYSGVISGAGNVVVEAGSDNLRFTSTNTYTGTTTIQGNASMLLTGSLASSTVTVNSTGALNGTGTLTGALINNGFVQPGAYLGTGTLTAGSYTQGSGGSLTGRLSDTGHSELDVTGAAHLDGQIIYVPQTPADKYVRGMTFTIISATGGVTGTFSKTGDGSAMPANNISTADNDTFIGVSSTPEVAIRTIYNSNSVQARIMRAEFFEDSGTTSNEQAVGAALDTQQLVVASGSDMDTVLNELSALPTVDQAAALDQLSGGINASVPTGFRDGQRAFDGMLAKRLGGDCNTMNDSPVSSFTPASSYYGGQRYYPVAYNAVPGRGRAGWACGYGNFGEVDGDANAGSVKTSGTGGAFGMELNPGPRMQVRVGMGFSNNTLEVNSDKATLNSYQAGLYGQLTGQHIYAGLGASGAYNTGDTTRHVIFGGLNRAASGDINGYTMAANGTAGIFRNFGRIKAELGATVEYIYTNQDAYTETGGGAVDLDVGSQTLNSLRTSLAAQMNTSIPLGGATVLTPEVRAGIFNDAMDVTPSAHQGFTGTGTSFTVNGPNPGRTGFEGGLGATVNFRRLSLFGDYNGTFKNHETSHMIVGGMKLKW